MAKRGIGRKRGEERDATRDASRSHFSLDGGCPHTMSTETPGPSQSPVQEVPTPNATQDVVQAADTDRLVLEYLKVRGYKGAEEALSESIDDSSESNKAPESTTISADELISKIAVFASKPSRPGENVFKSTPNVLEGLVGMNNPTTIHDLIASLGAIGAEDILVSDPTDKRGGYRELEAWVEGSLEMYQVRTLARVCRLLC